MFRHTISLFTLSCALFFFAACTSPTASPAADTGMDGMSMPGGGSMAADALPPATSTDGLFTVTATSQMDPVTINTIHSWLLHVQTGDGVDVTDAQIDVEGSMPAHSHGLPTTPQITENRGNGDYLLEGMKFNMAGSWVITATITAGGQSDTAVFDLQLK